MPLWRKLGSKLKIKESAKIHNEGLSGEICRFLVFFWDMTWSIRGMNFRDLRPALHEFPQTNSPKTPDIWPVSKKKYFTQNFGNLASYKKGLNKIGSKMAALKGFSFGHFSKT